MEETYDYVFNDSVVIPSQSPVVSEHYKMRTSYRYMYVAVYSATICIGLLLNTAVIFMTVKFRSEKKLSRRVLILGLSVTHLVLCLFTPLHLISAWNYFSWTFGKVGCKLGSYVIFLNMFSASLIITFWNVRWCVPTCCDCHMSTNMVLLSWFAGAILSAPSLLSREVQYTADGFVCLDNYDYTESLQVSRQGRDRMIAVVLCRFLLGLLLPLGVTCLSCFCVRHQKNNINTSLILRPVTIAHFLCWAPVVCLPVLQITMKTNSRWFAYTLPPATALSVLNSCICPAIIIWQGRKELNSGSQFRRTPQTVDQGEENEMIPLEDRQKKMSLNCNDKTV